METRQYFNNDRHTFFVNNVKRQLENYSFDSSQKEAFLFLYDNMFQEIKEEIINSVVSSANETKTYTNESLKLVIAQMDKRFDDVNKRFEDMQKYMNKHFEDTNIRFDDVNRRFDDVNRRFEDVNKRFEQVDKRFEDMRHYMDRRFNSLQWTMGIGFTAITTIMMLIKLFG